MGKFRKASEAGKMEKSERQKKRKKVGKAGENKQRVRTASYIMLSGPYSSAHPSVYD